MALVIPLQATRSGASSVRVRIDGVLLEVQCTWMQRTEEWRIDVLSSSGEVLVAGALAVPGTALWSGASSPGLPPGVVLCVDLGGRGEPPGIEDLGSRVVLVYATVADLGPPSDLLSTITVETITVEMAP